MRITLLDTTGSTNDEAYERLNAGDPGPVAVRARVQRAGRGRLSRAWASPEGGLWMTVGVVTTRRTPPCLPLRVALALWDAIAPVLDDNTRLRIKWPNDLLLDGLKCAGILCESRTLDRGRRCLLVGTGVNADFDPSVLPDHLRDTATTIRAATGTPVDVASLADRLAASVLRAVRAPENELTPAELRTLIDRLAYLDTPVSLRAPDGTDTRGVLEGLTPDGRAVLRTDRGLAFVSAGDVAPG
ncbi:MAG: biotin--[acetyl-CoA-carboxylase] ligase [Planctomycetota bacterium]